MNKTSEKLRVLIIEDGRPGHVHLAHGIAAAVNRTQDSDVIRLQVSMGSWAIRHVARIINLGLPPSLGMRMVYGLSVSQIANADLVISAGGETLAANIWISRYQNVQNIFYGSLRNFKPSHLTLALTSYRSDQAPSNVVRTLKPSAFDPSSFDPPKPDKPSALGLIIGGPNEGVEFLDSDWQCLSRLVQDVFNHHHIPWIVSNSARTPHKAWEAFRHELSQYEGAIQEWIDVDEPDAPKLPHLLSQVDGVVCTADSSSMVSEGIWARRPVICAETSVFDLSENESEYRSWLSSKGWCKALPLATLTGNQLMGEIRLIQPMQDNPVDALASLVSDRLSPSPC